MIESEFERGLFALRQEKLNQIAALAQKTYPNQFPRETLAITWRWTRPTSGLILCRQEPMPILRSQPPWGAPARS